MRHSENPFLHLVMGCMDFCWLFAWARLTTSSLIPFPFPFPESILAFTLGGVLAHTLKGRGWPVIYVLGLHLLLFTVASGLMLRAAFAPACAPLDVASWLRALGGLAPPFGWVRISVVWVWGVCFWADGVRLATRPGDRDTVSARFDFGLMVFFVLLLVQSFISLRLGGDNSYGFTRYLMLSFLPFGLLCMGLSRSRTPTQKQYRMGFGSMGVLLSFSAVALLLGTGLVSLFFPYLTEGARMGYGQMKAAASHAEPYLIAILRFMFGSKAWKQPGESAAASWMVQEPAAPFEYSAWVERVVTVMGWGLLGLLGLAALVAASVALWYFVVWLFSRTAKETDDEPFAGRVHWWSILQKFFSRLPFGQRMGRWGPIQLFSFLVAWGSRSGLPRQPHETPCEYGARLEMRFPQCKSEFERVVELFNRRVYGEMDPRPGELREGHASRRQLSSPLRWPARLRSRLSGSG
jgi:hypothetical protein